MLRYGDVFFCVCLNVKRQQINLTVPTLQRLEREQEQILVFFPIPLLSRRLWSSFGLSEGLQNIDQSRAYQILGRSVQESSRCHVEKRTVEQRPSAESSKRTYLFDSRISFRVWENPLAWKRRVAFSIDWIQQRVTIQIFPTMKPFPFNMRTVWGKGLGSVEISAHSMR